MMMSVRMTFVISVTMLSAFHNTYSSDLLRDAEDAFKSSDYKKAEKLYTTVLQLPEIEQGDAKVKNRAQINLGETLFARGKFKEGYSFFDARLNNPDGKRKPLQKVWNGSCAQDSCSPLLVRGEHGIGDTFFFMRYMKQLHDAGIPVVVRERGFLIPLLKRQPYIKQVIKSDDDEAKLTYTSDVYAMSLPRYVSNRGLQMQQAAADIPYTTGYIEPRADLVAKWKTQFSDKQKLHVLIGAYRASANVAGECRYLRRDCAIADLIKKLARPNVVLYYPGGGDYKPVKRSEYERLKAEGKLGTLKNFDDKLDIIEDADWDKLVLLGGDFDQSAGAFEDTAAVICASDYVVSVDTSTAMLAGALGVKHFGVLLSKESDWRWGEGQPTTTPFFANARLFWQKTQDDWSAPLDALGETIAQASEAKESSATE